MNGEDPMELAAIVSGFPGAVPLAGLPDAWRWSSAPVLNFAAVLSSDGRHLLQMNVLGRYDEGLVRAVLEFARAHGGAIAASGRPLLPIGGFSHPGFGFDTVAAVPPAVHGHHARELPELGAVTFGVFPGHHCEFSGNESEEEAWGRFNKMLRPTRIDREPVPFLKMRYDNPRTRSRSEGPDRGLTTLPVLLRELDLLQDAPGGFVEWENRHGEVRRAEWEGTWQLQDASGCRGLGPDELKALAEHSLTGPAPAAGR